MSSPISDVQIMPAVQAGRTVKSSVAFADSRRHTDAATKAAFVPNSAIAEPTARRAASISTTSDSSARSDHDKASKNATQTARSKRRQPPKKRLKVAEDIDMASSDEEESEANNVINEAKTDEAIDKTAEDLQPAGLLVIDVSGTGHTSCHKLAITYWPNSTVRQTLVCSSCV